MMECSRCKSIRLTDVSAKCNDMFGIKYGDSGWRDGCVTGGIGIGGGDYLEFQYCLECGQIQDKFPVEDPDFNEM